MRKQDLQEIKDWTFYKIVQDSNGNEVYGGRTALWYDRKRNHRLRADNPDQYSNSRALHRYMHKHGGRKAFSFVVVQEKTCTRELAEALESAMLEKLNSPLNIVR